ncbi:MAG: transglutaminase family protein [Planctomycetes bacterium]|nr:transglutaminase family protein [Planctomycetota bacterium]
MPTRFSIVWIALVIFLTASTALGAQQSIVLRNDFESDRVGDTPKGWLLPKPCAKAGYALSVTEASSASGKHSVELRGKSVDAGMFGNCMRSIDATALRGKRVRFSAQVRCEPDGDAGGAMLWFRVDRADREMGFFDNMGDRPIRSSEWKRYEIVGDVASDAEAIALGMMLLGEGKAMFDDVLVEVVDPATPTTGKQQLEGVPGLAVALYEAKLHVRRATKSATFRFPLPLAYRDQTPLTFNLRLEPDVVDARVRITEGPGPNRVLELELRDVEPRDDLVLRYESVVLVAPTAFDKVPATAPYPETWPEEAAPWLAATWCCDAKDERIQAIGASIRAEAKDVRAAVDLVLKRSQDIFEKAQGRVRTLTAVEALDKQGSCTSCANLVAALLRASGIPARILAGYPLWSGPLQTHYIVEAYVPGFGWYPVESTLGRAAWPNCQQVNVSLVPIEHEAEARAGQRPGAAGAVPFLTLTEYGEKPTISFEGTLKDYCDHEARQVRTIDADAAAWKQTQDWARARWAKWLVSKPEVRGGRVQFGPRHEALTAKSLVELRAEL